MKSKTLAACLLLTAGLSTVSFVVQAGDTPQETVQPSSINTRDLKEGDRAPDILMRKESAVSDWKNAASSSLRQTANGRGWVTSLCCSKPPTAPFLRSPPSSGDRSVFLALALR